MENSRLIAVYALLAIAIFQTPVIATTQDTEIEKGFLNLPVDLRARYKQEIQQLSFTGYEEPAYYEAFLSRLDARVFDRADVVRFLHDLTQAMYDHDRGDRWLAALAIDLDRQELAAIRGVAIQEEIELLEVTLRDGRVLLGTGGPLSRHFRGIPEESLQEQRYLDPNLGVPGIGGLWLAKGDLNAAKRVMRPTPRAILVAGYSESFDEDGRLVIDGHWFRPGRGTELEKIALDVREVTNGGVWFENPVLHLRALRYTADYPELAIHQALDVDFQREMGWLDAPATRPALPAALLELIETLRADAPEIAWPTPFNPDPGRAAAVLARDDLVFGEPSDSLLRIRYALTYGDDLPRSALLQPRDFLTLERRVMACLDGRPLQIATDAPTDPDTLLAVIRHAPRFDPTPGPLSPQAPVLLHLPADYSPWRTFPVMIALHGQGGAPQNELDAWVELCDREGVILVCPPHGSQGSESGDSRGGARDKESDDALQDTVRRVLLSTNADPDRVYVTGISMGAARTWHMIQTYPGRFAAAAPEIRGPSSYNGRFPLLPNAASVAVIQLEGEFDGENTTASRRAVFELKKLGGEAQYLESRALGHVRMSWRYPAVLHALLGHRRDAHPSEIDQRAFHRFRAGNAWLQILDSNRTHAWDREDGAFVLADLTGVKASFARGTVTLTRTKGDPTSVQIFHDPALMGEQIQIRSGGKSLRWTPAPTVQHVLERVMATGDRSRLYGDSIQFDL